MSWYDSRSDQSWSGYQIPSLATSTAQAQVTETVTTPSATISSPPAACSTNVSPYQSSAETPTSKTSYETISPPPTSSVGPHYGPHYPPPPWYDPANLKGHPPYNVWPQYPGWPYPPSTPPSWWTQKSEPESAAKAVTETASSSSCSKKSVPKRGLKFREEECSHHDEQDDNPELYFGTVPPNKR